MAIQNTFYLDVDIKRDNYVDEPKVTQNDAVTFVLRMTDDGVDYPLAGVSTYTLATLRPDGQSVLTVGTLTAPNEITFELGTTEVSVPGNVKAAIQLYDAEGRVSSIPFTYEVSKDFAIDYVPSTDEQTLIQLVLGEGPAILAATEAATVDAIRATSDLTVLKSEVVDATNNANTSADYASTEGDRASTQADRADLAATDATESAEYATTQGDYAKAKGDEATAIIANGPVTSVNGQTGAVDGLATEKELQDLGNGIDLRLDDIFHISPSVLKIPLSRDYRGWQGLTAHNRLIYVVTDRNEDFSLENIISVYTLDGKLVTEKRNAYTELDPQGKFMSFGDINEIDGFLYVTAYNFNSNGNPSISRVVKLNIPDLSVSQVYDIGNGAAESVTKHDGFFWVVYHNTNIVRKFNLSFIFVQEYELPINLNIYGNFQGSLWEGNLFYANLHGQNSNGDLIPFTELRKYEFDGVRFNFIESIAPPTGGCGQGLTKYENYYFWNDRPNNLIIVSKHLKRGNVFSEVIPYQNEFTFKPPLLNGFEPFDIIHDRTIKITVLNGMVYLSGMVKNITAPNPYNGLTSIFKIPQRYAPKVSINVIGLTDKGIVRIPIVGKYDTEKVGEVNAQNIMSYENIGWLSLDGISYPIID